MATAIRAEALTKDFSTGFWRRRATRALDGLSLEVPLGGVFGLLGPNGAGKSTTLKILMHLLWPTSGRAEVLGRPPGDVDARRRLGFLPEHPTFYDHLTAEEVLTYFAGLFGYAGSDRARRVRGALDLVGLGDARSRPMRGYSKGMLQRVGLAQALVNDPELVVLDEPMSGLDPLGRREVRDLILRLRDRGTTVFFSSHILGDAEAICSRVGIVAGGRLAAAGTLAEMVPFRIRAWDIVAGDLSEAGVRALGALGATATPIGADRHQILLPASVSPDEAIARMAAAGGRLVSLNPVRDTLEDFFLAQVRQSEGRRAG
jgi:ABC-2 type transport system ATP-binding protein